MECTKEATESGRGVEVSGRVLHMVRNLAVVDFPKAARVDVEFVELEGPITVWWDDMPGAEAR